MAPIYHTIYFYDNLLPKKQNIALLTVYIVVVVFSIVVNSVLAKAIVKLNTRNLNSFLFIFILSISDLCTDITLALYIPAFNAVGDGSNASEYLHLSGQFLVLTGLQFSAIMAMIISVDRYIQMKYLNNYNTIMTKRRAYIMIFLNIITSLIIAILYTLASLYGFFSTIRVLHLCICFGMLFLVILSYTRAFTLLRKRVTSFRFSNNRVSPGTNNIKRADLQFAKSVFLILLSLTLFYVPHFVCSIIILVYESKEDEKTKTIPTILASVYFWSTSLIYMFSLVNALWLLLFNRKLRKEFIRIAYCRRETPNSNGNCG